MRRTQCLLPSNCLTCICQIYIVFPWNPIKNVPFQLSSPPPCFYLPWRESCTIWWKKNCLHGKGGGSPPFTISVSRFTLFEGKKWTNVIGSRCWHCVGYWGWEELTQSLQLQWGIDGSQGLCDGSPSQLWEESRSCIEPKMKSLCDSNVQETPKIKLVWCLFLKPFPAECIMGIFQIILRLERQNKISLKICCLRHPFNPPLQGKNFD